MCTAISLNAMGHYFGRNLDLDHSYNESVVITPRNYPFLFRRMSKIDRHYGMVGMAARVDGYPLYYDATNECGLSMAGLNFPGNAVYWSEQSNKDNITPFEFIPWILCQCVSVDEARKLLGRMNLVNIAFNDAIPLTDLHWIISDAHSSIVVESGKYGLQVYENTVGVLTNNPDFPYHMRNLMNYAALSPCAPDNHLIQHTDLKLDSLGMGAIGLPGDSTSQSRFVRAVYGKVNSESDKTEHASVSRFFHILDSVSVINGCVKNNRKNHKTIYSSCCNTQKGIYYYKTYDNSQISAVTMGNVDLDSSEIIPFSLITEQQIYYQN